MNIVPPDGVQPTTNNGTKLRRFTCDFDDGDDASIDCRRGDHFDDCVDYSMRSYSCRIGMVLINAQ